MWNRVMLVLQWQELREWMRPLGRRQGRPTAEHFPSHTLLPEQLRNHFVRLEQQVKRRLSVLLLRDALGECKHFWLQLPC